MHYRVVPVLLALFSLVLFAGCPRDESDPALDTTPPDAVINLAASTGSGFSEIDLTWTATGDDGQEGTAASYLVKVSDSPFDASGFAFATTHSQFWAPVSSGLTENQTLAGMVPGQVYYIALKVLDELGNISAASNVATGSAPDPVPSDTTPPGAISDLAVSAGSSSGGLDLSWTAPGDDGSVGTAATYDVRYSTTAITSGNFASAPQVSQSWAPQTAGVTENRTLTGLTQGQTYFIAIKTSDEVPNTSAISNLPSAPTSPDTTAPAGVTDLSASTGTATGAIDLSWTAVGDDGNTGTATSIELRYSTSPITLANFASATLHVQSWTPLAAGSSENHTVTGLLGSTTYHFALLVRDEVPNASPLSNSAQAATSGTTASWQFEHPSAWGGNDLEAVWFAGASDAFAVGAGGTILRFNGTTWSRMSSPSTQLLMDVWGSSSSDVFAVGMSGTILHYNGTAWSSMSSGTTNVLYGVWGSSGSDVFAVGMSGTILHYSGASWSAQTSGAIMPLYSVWGSSGSDVFATGLSGTILYYNGSSWTSMTSNTSASLGGVWGSSGSDVYAVGYFLTQPHQQINSAIMYYNGSSWSPVMSGLPYVMFSDVWGSGSGDIYAVGAGGKLYHSSGTTWSPVTSGTTETLLGIHGDSPTNILAVGRNGTIQRRSGTSWSGMLSGPTTNLLGIWGSSSSDVFAVGDYGTFLHFDGTSWSSMNTGFFYYLNGVWGSSGSDVFMVGSNGKIMHYDGTGVSSMTSGTTQQLYGVWGTSGSDVYAVGSNMGPVYQYDGSSWSLVRSNTSTVEHLYGIHGTSSSDIFTVGSSGLVVHYDGTSWTPMSSTTMTTLFSVWCAGPSDVFAVGAGGIILHYNGSSWSTMTSGASNTLRGVWGNSGSDVYAVGDSAQILHYDGNAWSPMTHPDANALASVWCAGTTSVFAAGGGGTILQYK